MVSEIGYWENMAGCFSLPPPSFSIADKNAFAKEVTHSVTIEDQWLIDSLVIQGDTMSFIVSLMYLQYSCSFDVVLKVRYHAKVWMIVRSAFSETSLQMITFQKVLDVRGINGANNRRKG